MRPVHSMIKRSGIGETGVAGYFQRRRPVRAPGDQNVAGIGHQRTCVVKGRRLGAGRQREQAQCRAYNGEQTY